MIRKHDPTIVVSDNTLFEGNTPFYGFSSADRIDYKSKILAKHDSMTHGEASHHPNLKQLAVCYFIVNPELDLISAFKISKDSKNCKSIGSTGDELSSGEWSCSYGKHVEFIHSTDSITDSIGNSVINGIDDPLLYSRLVDLKKKIRMDGTFLDAKLLGYIHGLISTDKPSETEIIRRLHFTVVYTLITDAMKIENKTAYYSTMISPSDFGRKVDIYGRPGSCISVELITRQSYMALSRFMKDLYVNNVNK